jgi:hypothetical protein
MQQLQNRTVNDMGEQFRIVMEVYELEDGVSVCATDLNGSPMSFAPLTVATMDTREEALAWMAELPRMTTVQPPPEGRLLTQEEREEAMRSAGQLQRETDQPVSVFAAVCVAQDKKTAEFFQAQVDAAEADAARSMAAYKDLYASTQLIGQMLEERSYEALPSHAISSDNGGGVGSNHDVTVGNSGAVEIGKKTTG